MISILVLFLGELTTTLPPNEIISTWEHDYKTMQNFMIIGESLPREILIQRITKIQNLINNK